MTGEIKRPRAAAWGFTLIELLVVMAIIGTLLSIAVPRYFRALEHARETALKQDLATLRDPQLLRDDILHRLRVLRRDPQGRFAVLEFRDGNQGLHRGVS